MRNRKKILYVITKANWGGAQKYVFDLATNLPRERFEAVVAAGGRGPLFDKLREAGIRTIVIPGLQRDIHILKELISLASLFKIFRHEQPDIIHLNSTKVGGLGALTAFFYKFLTPKTYSIKPKVIFTVHGWGFKEDRPVWQKGIIFLLTWFGSLFQDAIIAISTADYVTGNKFISKRNLHLVFNGLDAFKFLSREKAREFIIKLSGRPIGASSLVFATIAEYTKNKGLSELLEAFGELRRKLPKTNWQAFIMGEGEDREILSQKIKTLGLTDHVRLTGFVADARQYLHAFDIFVLPSRKEGLPYVIMEAMSAGVPVVATQVGGIPDLIENGVDGILCKPGHPAELAAAMAKLATDETLRNKLGTSASEKMCLRFRFQNMIDRTITLYEQS